MKRAHSQTLILIVASLLATALPAQDFLSKVEEYMQAQVKTSRFTGAILVARDGKTLVAKGYGMANLEHGVPNTPLTRFRLGSITKQFTSMAIVMLEERGKLSVQEPICKYVSDCPPAWTGVTIHHLLTHTSGIPSYTDMPDYREAMILPITPDKMLARFRDKPLEFQPGDKYKYSNSGYFLLGIIIEKVSGQSYEEFLRANIFEPLGMKNSGYDRSEVILKNRAAGYALAGAKVVNAPYLDMSQPYAAGSLYSTVEDLLVWDQALYTEKLAKKESLERIFTPFKDNYAYGWTVASRFNRRYVGHGGGINGFVTDISRYPDDRLCVVVLSNLNGVQPGRISRDLAAIAYGEKYEIPAERVTAKVDMKIYDALVGRYELNPTFVLTVTRDGDHLLVQATGQPQVEIFPESETKFFAKAVDAQITFVKGDQGQVTELILHQGGRDQRAKKLP